MENSMLLPVVTTALSVGLGCGACCSPLISMFLSTYVASHAGGVKSAFFAFFSFFFGKILSVSALCIVAAVISRQFIGADGYIGQFNLRLAAQITMSAIGLIMIIRWFLVNRKKPGCQDCHSCNRSSPKEGIFAVFTAGITYGFTPCTPLILMIGYAFTLPVIFAGTAGIVFALSSALSPILLLVVISGALSKRLSHEIPQYLKWFQLASYTLLMVMPYFVTI